MKFSIIAFFFFAVIQLSAQTVDGLQILYSFDNNTVTDDYSNSTALVLGTPVYGCGVKGSALKLSGIPGEGIQLYGQEINSLFRIADFTLSFYFKSTENTLTRDLISKRTNCAGDSSIAIRYSPNSGQLSCEVSENPSKSASVIYKLDRTRCWQLVTLVRSHSRTLLYINGRLAGSNTAISRLNLTNDSPLNIGADACSGPAVKPLKGYIDELRVYDRALTEDEIKQLYYSPDLIVNRDTTVFLGGSVPISTTPTCATSFSWSPSNDVSNAAIANPVITPSLPGKFAYLLSMGDGECTSVDTIQIKVIDPSTLDCSKAFLPSAFTPNGDGTNDLFYISNYYVIDELISFEIFDRWGAKVFETTDPEGKWDGNFRGQAVNPGVMLYKVVYVCNGEQKTQVGTVTIIR